MRFKSIAIPARFLDPVTFEMRENLTPEEQQEFDDNYGHQPFTAEEETAADIAEAQAVIDNEKETKNNTRQKALADVWPDAFALLDDILNRGIVAVKTDRDAIKLVNPKGG